MKPNFVTRTVKNGQVKVYGKIYKPDNKRVPYDGRLDGMVYYFALYYGSGGELEDFIYLGWPVGSTTYGPELVDGFFPWMWWRTEPKETKGA